MYGSMQNPTTAKSKFLELRHVRARCQCTTLSLDKVPVYHRVFVQKYENFLMNFPINSEL
jgi:hypothetical protein